MPWTLRSVRKGEPPSGVEQPVVFAIALLARWFTPTARGPLRVMIRRSWSLAAGGDPDRRAGLVRRRPRLLPSTNQLVAHLRRPIGGNECSRAPGTRVRLTPQYRPMRRPLSTFVRLSAGGRWIRTFGPLVQTMLLDTADPLAGRSLRETAPRWISAIPLW